MKYVIKRLVRGVGASTTTSRAGFFTTLVGFLQTVNSEELEAKSVLDIAAKQLHVGKSVNNKVSNRRNGQQGLNLVLGRKRCRTSPKRLLKDGLFQK